MPQKKKYLIRIYEVSTFVITGKFNSKNQAREKVKRHLLEGGKYRDKVYNSGGLRLSTFIDVIKKVN